MQAAIRGQSFGQSGTAGFSSGQQGMSSGIADRAAAAIATPSIGTVKGPATSPTIARIGSSLRSQALTFMGKEVPQAEHSDKMVRKTKLSLALATRRS